MSEPTYEIETVRKVFDNDHGGYITVGPDSEGLGLVEINGHDLYGQCILAPPAHALVLAEAITLAAKELMR